MPRRVPVLLLAGPLGAGKTTLLNHLLHDPAGRRLGVVVNDFGGIAVDALAVAGQVDAMASLSNGCLCCAVGADGLDALLSRLTRPTLGLDGIVVEASGLAEPRELVRQLLETTDPRAGYGGLVLLVDAEHGDVADPLLPARLRVADLVVVTKADRVDAARLAAVRDAVAAAAPGRPVVVGEHGRVDPALLLDVRDRPSRAGRAGPVQLSLTDLLAEVSDDGRHAGEPHDHAGHDHAGHAHPHEGWTSVEVTVEEPLAPAAFLRFVENRPAGLFRSKGFVTFAAADPRHRRFTVHTVGDHLHLEPLRGRASRDVPQGSALVLLGTGMDADDVAARLRACAATSAAHDEDGALGRLLVLAGVARA